jgi:hypothetical protein
VQPEQDKGAHKVADVSQFGEFAADFEIENRRRCPHKPEVYFSARLSVQEEYR